MKWRSISRPLALAGSFGSVIVAGGAVERWLAQPRVAAAAHISVDTDALFHDPEDPVIGNPAGTLRAVEFFEYRCLFCRRMHPLLQRLLAEDHGIRFFAEEWPIFGGPSVRAARIALAEGKDSVTGGRCSPPAVWPPAGRRAQRDSPQPIR